LLLVRNNHLLVYSVLNAVDVGTRVDGEISCRMSDTRDTSWIVREYQMPWRMVHICPTYPK